MRIVGQKNYKSGRGGSKRLSMVKMNLFQTLKYELKSELP